MKQRVIVCLTAVLLAAVITLQPAKAEAPTCQAKTDALCYQPSAQPLINKLNTVTMPEIAVPVWLGTQP